MPRVIVIVFPGCQSLDFAGPVEVFAAANGHLKRDDYDLAIVSTGGGLIDTTGSFAITTGALTALKPRVTDTVLVSGGDRAGVTAATADLVLTGWLRKAAPVVARLGSVCTGSFVLAAAGLLDGKPAATHWSACARLQSFRPEVAVDREAIFIETGRLWTSAGVTAGIDMAIAMVEADHGRALADAIAAELVLYTRRPGFQSQWSDALVAQIDDRDELGAAISWARGHLRGLDVPALASRAGLSVRSLHRRCAERLRTTPAKLIEQLRVEHARSLLAAGRLQAKTIASQCGFGQPARMTRAFRRALGVGPRDYQLLFAGGDRA